MKIQRSLLLKLTVNHVWVNGQIFRVTKVALIAAKSYISLDMRRIVVFEHR